MKKEFPNLNAILINGDFVTHGVAIDDQSGDKKNAWIQMKKTIFASMKTIRE
jgi:hypothetical protein